MPHPVTVRTRLARLGAVGVLAALLSPAALSTPAQAASRVTVDAQGGEGAVIDSTYSTRLRVSGGGFQSVQGGHGGIYVSFGTVNGTWRPSQGGQSGVNYLYVPDGESKQNAGHQRFVSFPGSSTADAANGGVMGKDGSWSVDLLVPGPKFKAVGRNGSVVDVDCRKVTCGVITIGAHGVKSARNETFTPVRVADLQGAAPASGTAADAPTDDADPQPEAAPGAVTPAPGAPGGPRPQRAARGPAKLTVDHAAAVAGRAMSFSVTRLTPGEQFTVVLDDGEAAAGPFFVGDDGRASGVVALPAEATPGTHELRLFGASKEASVKFGLQAEQEVVAASSTTDRDAVGPWAPVAFVVLAAVVFLVALTRFVLRMRGGRRAVA